VKTLKSYYEILKDPAGFYVRDFVQKVAFQLAAGAKILDAGAGQCVYKPCFKHCQYTAVDNAVGDGEWDYSQLDMIAPLQEIPVADAFFDAVLCTEVLEHLDEPLACLKELSRVLKPNGRLFLTVPFFHHEHQVPYDYFRYTSYGLKMLLVKAGFSDDSIQIEPTAGGIFLRWAYELTSLFAIFPQLRIGRGKKTLQEWMLVPLKLFVLFSLRFCQLALIAMDPLDRSQIATFGWSVIALKKPS